MSDTASPAAAAPESDRKLSETTENLISSVTSATSQGRQGGLDESVEIAIWLASETGVKDRIDTRTVDAWIANLDAQISGQVDLILHHPKFQALESAWRGLQFLVSRTNFEENIEIQVLQASSAELKRDFDEASGDLKKTGLYKQVGRAEYGQYGGKPYGLILGNYQFSSSAKDMEILSTVAAVSSMAHAPFIAAASPELLGLSEFGKLGNVNNAKDLIKAADSATKWNAFRQSEDSRYVGLTLPRFLLRVPYEAGGQVAARRFAYNESVQAGHEAYLWGNTSFAFGSRITDSFAKHRWYQNIIGPQAGGTVLNLPMHVFESSGRKTTKIPTEVLIPEALEVNLSGEGLIPLVMRKGEDQACFFAANSCQGSKNFPKTPDGDAAATNFKLGMQLPYMFIMTRLAHYLKVQQRESIGRSLSAQELQTELNTWISQYVVAQDVVDELVKAKRPLRDASVTVTPISDEPGWYKIGLKVRPHIKFMGAFFELSLVGKVSNKK